MPDARNDRPKLRAGIPWAPPIWELSDASALQALARGDADEHAQRRAIKWIIEKACATYDMSFQPESDRATSFAEGRRFVGLQVVKLINLNLAALRAARTGEAQEQQ